MIHDDFTAFNNESKDSFKYTSCRIEPKVSLWLTWFWKWRFFLTINWIHVFEDWWKRELNHPDEFKSQVIDNEIDPIWFAFANSSHWFPSYRWFPIVLAKHSIRSIAQQYSSWLNGFYRHGKRLQFKIHLASGCEAGELNVTQDQYRSI